MVARKELELKTTAEMAIFTKRNSRLSKQNKVLKEALGEMTSFFQQVDSDQSRPNPNQVESKGGLLDS